jgi:hypothetical protein
MLSSSWVRSPNYPPSTTEVPMEVSADIVERVDPIFYGEPLAAALKALGAE